MQVIVAQISRILYRTRVRNDWNLDPSRTDQERLDKGRIEWHFFKAKLFNLSQSLTAKRSEISPEDKLSRP